MKTRAELVRSFATTGIAVAIALTCAACSSTPTGSDDAFGSVEFSAAGRRSPAAERVIGGIAEMVLTDRPWPSYEEARLNPVRVIGDGAPLYAAIRSSRPLRAIAHPPDPGGELAFSAYPHLFLQVGDNESLRILSTCYLTLTTEEAARRDLVVALAPLTNRPGQIPADCWLDVASGAKPGRRVFEIRLAGFPGKFERWLPVPDLLALSSLQADFVGGAGEYATMLKAGPRPAATVVANVGANVGSGVGASAGAGAGSGAGTSVSAGAGAIATPIRGSSLVAASPVLPGERQDIGSSRIDLQLLTLTAVLIGRRPSEAYFVDAQWATVRDSRGRTNAQQAFAAAIFKGDSCSWQRLRVTRQPGAASLSDVQADGNPVTVSCSDLP